MKFIPHDYQQYAIDFIESHKTAAVLLDMGLGKTVITLTALNDLLFDHFEISRVLVIAPLRVARNTWPQEIEKWEHLKHLRYSVAVGAEKERIQALRQQASLYIINRENVSWLIEKTDFAYDAIVIDELSSFKNWSSKRFKALMKVRPLAKRVIGLTGTPSGNGLMDLFAEFKVLDMGQRLGRFITKYRQDYFVPDKRNGQVVFSYVPLPGAEERIYEKIADITISMKASDHLNMPKLIESEYSVRMDEAEKKMYDSMCEQLVLQMKGDEVTAANAGVLSGKLAQMANGAVYTDDGATLHIHDRKLDALEDIIESMNGKPLLVAYWFRHDAERIEKRVPCVRLDTDDAIARWNRGEIHVALIHPASAGHGLNLQSGGSTLVWFGITWSLELYQQTVARLYRQGQSANTVVVRHIIVEGTIDERILRALKRKDKTQTALIEAVKAEVTS
ncbi:DEAD/DEAH box helicase [Selenomonas sp. oral taxon 920]|uniref:DEAD/DEAH box helicase n=1 Tax=Selenomonas sp. oral taxon 920 TaxID=1884263 RepID=UPI000840A6DD|nr:DEAD/DEAH box helicase [Selenomonas sp. oral taxon 920]AOH48119.1 DEAD/DEAH box helicase [Selenomonas sp. oral taxon 920]